jgi:hypothetical protein
MLMLCNRLNFNLFFVQPVRKKEQGVGLVAGHLYAFGCDKLSNKVVNGFHRIILSLAEQAAWVT